MSAVYPSGIYSPRTKENEAGVVYTPANTKIGYAEDVVYLDQEVVAIETELGTTPKQTSASVAERLKGIRSLSDATADVINIKAGTVGIATENPIGKLDVSDNTLPILNIRSLQNNASWTQEQEWGILGFYTSDTTGTGATTEAKISAINDLNQTSRPAGALAFFTANTGIGTALTERMRIKSDGKVGIGITLPTANLDIRSASGDVVQIIQTTDATFKNAILRLSSNVASSTGKSQIDFGDGDDGDRGRLWYDHSDDSMQFSTAATERMRIKNDGNVGIGTTNPTSGLDLVNANTAITYSMSITGRKAAEGAAGLYVSPLLQANEARTNLYGAYINPTTQNNLAGADATNYIALRIGALPGTGDATNSYGLYVDEPTSGTNKYSAYFAGKVGIGTTAPTAVLHLKACTASANTASLKIDPGTVASSPVSGNIESDGTHLYWTDSGGTRRQLDN